jgi:hypothetical protein
MAIETNTIKVTEDTTLDEVLDSANDHSVRIERDGIVYSLQRTSLNTSDEWDEELAERRRKDLRETAGAWKDLDIEAIRADFHRRRGRDTTVEDLWKDYDPQAIIDMLEDFKNNPMDIDAAQWIADVYRSREEGSRSDDRS